MPRAAPAAAGGLRRCGPPAPAQLPRVSQERVARHAARKEDETGKRARKEDPSERDTFLKQAIANNRAKRHGFSHTETAVARLCTQLLVERVARRTSQM